LPLLPLLLLPQVWLMLSDGERKQLTKLKQDLQEVRAMTTDMYGLGQAVGGSLLQGEHGSHACPRSCIAPHVLCMHTQAVVVLACVPRLLP
jgi:hypothetical protein